ncbi:MAG: alpha/beta fold hydrolase [Pseudomonadales bacterium]|nr:alpha/beta fold hydrolase [Pseudomonadales bacterium]
MIKKILKIVSLSFLALILSVLLIGAVSSSLSLDREFNHSNSTEELPRYAESANSNRSTELVLVEANGFEFRTRIANNDNNPTTETIILLHGFPTTSAMWEPIIGPLASAGYRVVAFDQRGYSPGARPLDSSAYQVSELVSDVFAVADAIGVDQFHLIGHDWGSAVGWATVMEQPDRILTWTGISIAHPSAFGEALANDPDQQARSSYFLLFTMPWVPETLFTFNNLSLLMSTFADMRPSQQDEYRAVFSEPGALSATLNWYRQMGAEPASDQEPDPYIETPSFFIWGNDDPSAGRAGVDAQEQYMTGPYLKLELAGGHWLITSHSNVIMQPLLEHLASI